MLELAKIVGDIDNLGRERAESLTGLGEQFSQADGVVKEIARDLGHATHRIKNARTSWLVASFGERPDAVHPRPLCPSPHAVVAVDGSQIAPDRHEAAVCYLLNAASVILYYGTSDRPESKTVPKLCYREDELFEEYGGRRVPVADKLLAMRRTLAESDELLHAIETAEPRGVPVVALWDGSLIRWALENEPPDYKRRVLSRFLHTFEVAGELNVPIAGYISDPGSKDFVNSMRVMLCDMDTVDCDKCAHTDVTPGERPCDGISRLTDGMVFGRRLQEGERSVIFTSGSRILSDYGEHEIRAFYLNIGREVVRIEIPKWVADNPLLLDLVHAVCWDQAEKGRGYPVALAEAHEKAVIRGPERRAFYEMVERSFIKHGAPISRSLKRIAKGY